MNSKIILRMPIINDSFQYNDMKSLTMINEVLTNDLLEKVTCLSEAVNCCITSYIFLVITQTALFQIISSLKTFQKLLKQNKEFKQVSITLLNIVAITNSIKYSFHKHNFIISYYTLCNEIGVGLLHMCSIIKHYVSTLKLLFC